MPEFTKRDERHRGEQRDERHRGEQRRMRRITQEHTRTHQDTPGPSRTHPASTRMPHELTEALKTQNGVTMSSTRTKGTPRRPDHGALFAVANPSDGNSIASRAHTASHRTHERNETISRLSHPPTSDLWSTQRCYTWIVNKYLWST